VGALARDIHLAANPAFMPQRKIKDIDIAFQFILILMMKKSTRKGGDVLDLYDTNDNDYLKLVSARIIGRHIGNLLTNSVDLHRRVIAILRRKNSIPYRYAIEEGMIDIIITI
jgi:hypothetical protein